MACDIIGETEFTVHFPDEKAHTNHITGEVYIWQTYMLILLNINTLNNS